MDPFTLLDLPRRPRLDAHAIRSAFQTLARACHPDAVGGDTEAFAALNAAYAALSEPGTRLRLLSGHAPLPTTPSDMVLGFRIADFLRRAAQCERAAAATQALIRALAANENAALRAEAGELTAALKAGGTALESRLSDLDDRWPEVAPEEIAALAAEYLFFARWQGQLREARVSLEIAAPSDVAGQSKGTFHIHSRR